MNPRPEQAIITAHFFLLQYQIFMTLNSSFLNAIDLG